VLQTINVVGDIDGCSPVYMLYIKDTDDDTYKPLEEFIEIIEAEVVPATLTSDIDFNEETGDLNLHLSNADLELLRDRLTDDITGKISLDVAVRAMQPGSNDFGPIASIDDLPLAEFNVEIFDHTVVDACGDNRVLKTDLTLNTPAVSRVNHFTYRIAQAGETDEVLTVAGLNVHADDDTCALYRRIEVEDPTYENADGTMGRWVEFRTSDYATVSDADFKFDLEVTQSHYMYQLLEKFIVDYVEDDSEVPESITLKFRFTTYNPTSLDKSKVIVDVVHVEIISNGDHGQCVDAEYNFDTDAQDLTGTEFVVPMGGVPAPMVIQYTPVTSDIEGCAGLLKTTLEILRPIGTYEDYASRSWITEWDTTPEKRHAKFYVTLDMMADVAADIQDYNDGNDVFTITMRFAHYVTPVDPSDDPMYEEEFTIVFREQTLAEKCDLSELNPLTFVADQEYEVTKDDLAHTEFLPTVAESLITDCVVTQTLQILHTDGDWNDYDPNAASDHPFISAYDDVTKGASVGFNYPVTVSDMLAYQDDENVLAWTINMRYYTEIEQANPTDAGVLSDEFVVTIVERLYDPCNDNTITGTSTVADYNYVWEADMSQSDQYVDLTPNTYSLSNDECAIVVELQV
jgi:hypothetical protein